MNWLAKKWNGFWFEPATADNLALARILVFGSMAIFYVTTPYLFPAWGWHQTFSEWGGVSHVFWRPIWARSAVVSVLRPLNHCRSSTLSWAPICFRLAPGATSPTTSSQCVSG